MKITKYSVALVKEKQIEYKLNDNGRSLNNPERIAEFINQVYGVDEPQESFKLVCLDVKLKPVGVFVVSVGTVNQTQVHPRDIFQRAILCNANKIIVSHNHPSGDVNPSMQDRELTNIITKAGEMMGIELLDHIIIGADDENGYRYYSFKRGE
ncbi:MAG: JAB domain-containing protein [Peptoniphilus sp. oral taxon 375]|nr:JAB domain-containing protein [Peptoniphilus sp. oral taxon 375]